MVYNKVAYVWATLTFSYLLQLYVKEDALLNFKSELAVMDHEVQVCVFIPMMSLLLHSC